MKKLLIYTSYGEIEYEILIESQNFIYVKEKENKWKGYRAFRYNKDEQRVEYRDISMPTWDVYISDSEILDVQRV